MRFLIVHESAMMRRLIQRVLSAQGCAECVEAKDGEEAVRAAESGRFDGVVTDWCLGRLDGASFIRTMRGRPEHRGLPVVLVTSNGLPDVVRRMVLPMVTDCLETPFTLEALHRTIGRVTRARPQAADARGTRRAVRTRSAALHPGVAPAPHRA